MTPEIPENFSNIKRVEFVPPPDLTKVTKMVSDAAANIAPGKKGQLMWITHYHEGQLKMNFAVAIKPTKSENVKIVMWVAKTWGEPVSAGIAGTVDF